MMAKKKMITEQAFVHIDIDGESLADIIKEVKKYQAAYGDDAVLVSETLWGETTQYIQYEREETDEEMKARLKKQAADRERNKRYREKKAKETEERERKLLEKLRKKYESK